MNVMRYGARSVLVLREEGLGAQLGLLYTRLALQPPNVSNDVCNLLALNPRHRWHVTEPPMMRSHAERGGAIERFVSMMAGLVDPVDQRGTLLAARPRRAVAPCTILIEEHFALAVGGRRGGWRECRVISSLRSPATQHDNQHTRRDDLPTAPIHRRRGASARGPTAQGYPTCAGRSRA